MTTSLLNITPIKVGIVGLGRAGWTLHLDPILKIPGFQVVAVADPIPDRVKEAAARTGCSPHSSMDELLANSDANLVVVATPSLSHFEDAMKVLEAGRHCIAEKPMTLTTEEAARLVRAAHDRNLGLFVHHTYLHLPMFHHMRKILASGALGELHSVRVCWAEYKRRWDWQTLKKNGGGLMNNIGSHVLSIILPLMGSRVRDVFADLRNIKDAGDSEDHIQALLRTESGVVADLLISTAVPLSGPRWTLCGSLGSMVSDETTTKLRFLDAKELPAREVVDGGAPGREYCSESLPWQEKELPVEPAPVRCFHENVYEVLAHGAAPGVTPESAAEVVRVTNLIQAFGS